jgi:hypothetical protein
MTMNAQLEYAVNNRNEVLHFLKSHYPMYHESNLFLRDVQFGLIDFFRTKGMRLRNKDAEKVAHGFLDHLKKMKIVFQIDQQTWALNYPEFAVQPVPKPQPAVKPQPALQTP